MDAHEGADLESRKRYSDVIEMDDYTDGAEDNSFYDFSEIVKSVEGSIYNNEMALYTIKSTSLAFFFVNMHVFVMIMQKIGTDELGAHYLLLSLN